MLINLLLNKTIKQQINSILKDFKLKNCIKKNRIKRHLTKVHVNGNFVYGQVC